MEFIAIKLGLGSGWGFGRGVGFREGCCGVHSTR